MDSINENKNVTEEFESIRIHVDSLCGSAINSIANIETFKSS